MIEYKMSSNGNTLIIKKVILTYSKNVLTFK